MHRNTGKFVACVAGLCLASVLVAVASQVDDQLTARKRVFKPIGPGLRTVKRGQDGKYYVLASPSVGVAIFDDKEKQLTVIGAPATAATDKAGRAGIAFGEDCDVDAQGNVYVVDRGDNLVTELAPDGKLLRSIHVIGPVSVAALPEGEVAVSTLRGLHLVTVYGPNGKVVREFGEPEEFSSRPEINRLLSEGRLGTDAQGRLYYGYTFRPEALVRQYDRAGYAGLDFEFTGLDAYPEAQAARKEIDKQEKKQTPPYFLAILTAFGVDPVTGEVWMALHNTLLHFDKEGNRRSEYQIYTPDGARLEANTILVEQDRLLIGADPHGVFDFERPDRKH
ncbi:MAG: hypothetical protein ABSG77_15795 [Candidatus Acidiferrum sp.]|jgi:hypothetical protein